MQVVSCECANAVYIMQQKWHDVIKNKWLLIKTEPELHEST